MTLDAATDARRQEGLYRIAVPVAGVSEGWSDPAPHDGHSDQGRRAVP